VQETHKEGRKEIKEILLIFVGELRTDCLFPDYLSEEV
jgi:hypothetical protein